MVIASIRIMNLLYLLFALSFSTNVRLLSILMATFLYSLLLCSLAVYKRWNNLILEMFFCVNLMAITFAILFDPSSNSRLAVSAIVQIGVGCVFVGFVAIIFTHVIMAMRRAKICQKKNSPHVSDTNQAKDHMQLKVIYVPCANAKLRESLLE